MIEPDNLSRRRHHVPALPLSKIQNSADLLLHRYNKCASPKNTEGDWEEMRKDTRRNICFVSCCINLNSCRVRLSRWLGAPWARWMQRPPGAAHCKSCLYLQGSNSHSAMFFLKHGYFSSTVIIAVPHQAPFWAPSLSWHWVLIKCLTDGLNSSICYNYCLLWRDEINHHTWWTEAQSNQFAAQQP